MKGEVDGFMAYLTNEAITVELAGYEVTNLPYAENGVPYVAETYSVTDDYLAENKDLLKALLTAEIKGWTDVFKEPTDATVDLITTVLRQGRVGERRGSRGRLRRARPEEDRPGPGGREGR